MAAITEIVVALLGSEPSRKGPRYWRFGANGRLQIDIIRGDWHDYGNGGHGQLPTLVERERGCNHAEAELWLKDFKYTPEDAARVAKRVAADNERRAKLRVRVRGQVDKIIVEAKAVTERHPELARYFGYFKKKQLDIEPNDFDLHVIGRSHLPWNNARQLAEGDVLIVPLRDFDGVVHSLQMIDKTGTKKYPPSGRTGGCFFLVGDDGELKTVLICEGLATALSLHEASGLPVAATMSAANLWAVASEFAARNTRIVVCGDDDWSKPEHKNEGRKAAIQCVERLRYRWPDADHSIAFPAFESDRMANHTDFNDMHVAVDDGAIAQVIHDALAYEHEHTNGGTEWPPELEPPPPDEEKEPPLKVRPSVHLRSLKGRELRPRRWIVKDWIPAVTVVMLAGDGAAGKTLAALQLAIAIASNVESNVATWFGLDIAEYGPVYFLTAEEDLDEVHRRVDAICKHMNIDYDADLYIDCMPGQNALLAIKGKHDVMEATQLFKELVLTVEGIMPKLIILESAADLFAGNEIDRSQVRQFITMLRALAIKVGATVLLLSHPSQAGRKGTGESGSTGWNNSVRSRMYLQTVKEKKNGDDAPEEEESEANPDAPRELKLMKANYAVPGHKVRLKWRDPGLFVIEGSTTPQEREQTKQREYSADQAFLKALEIYTAQGRDCGDNSASPSRYAPKVLRVIECAKPFQWRELKPAMERLLAADRIHVAQSGIPSRPQTSLRPGPKPADNGNRMDLFKDATPMQPPKDVACDPMQPPSEHLRNPMQPVTEYSRDPMQPPAPQPPLNPPIQNMGGIDRERSGHSPPLPIANESVAKALAGARPAPPGMRCAKCKSSGGNLKIIDFEGAGIIVHAECFATMFNKPKA